MSISVGDKFVDRDGTVYQIIRFHHLTGGPIYTIKLPNKKPEGEFYGRLGEWFLDKEKV